MVRKRVFEGSRSHPATAASDSRRQDHMNRPVGCWRNALARSRKSATMRLNMRSYVTVSAALCVFLTPILCMSGVLDHPCDCDAEMACGHEEDCAADPCHAFVAARFSSRPTPLLAHDSFPMPAFAAGLCALLPVRATTHLQKYVDEQASHACRLPFPRSDMPLLL